MVEIARGVLLEDAGLDLHRICGAGSSRIGGRLSWLEVRIKLDKVTFNSHDWMGILVEAAFLCVIERRKKNGRVGFFSVSLVREFGWTSGSALINGGLNLSECCSHEIYGRRDLASILSSFLARSWIAQPL